MVKQLVDFLCGKGGIKDVSVHIPYDEPLCDCISYESPNAVSSAAFIC